MGFYYFLVFMPMLEFSTVLQQRRMNNSAL